jgi:broad specificity phosphatase PhoE
MNLYLVRHAQPQADGDDPPLSPEGVQQAAKVAALFARVNPPRDRLTLLVSTLKRARRTAEALAEILAVAVADVVTFPGPDDEVDDLTERLVLRLQALAAAGRTELIVVGHSNYLPSTAARLLGTAAAPFPGGDAFAAAGCLICDGTFAPGSARLRWLVLPELLA